MRFRSEDPRERENDTEFFARIDLWVQTAASTHPNEFFKSLPGVWPIEAFASLRRLEGLHLLPKGYYAAIEKTLRQPRLYKSAATTFAKNTPLLEHPLDFEWCFTTDGQDILLTELTQLHGSTTASILCLGCPTLFERGKTVMPEKKFVLWDKNASFRGQISEAHSLAKVDLRHTIPSTLIAEAVVVDPPWYNDFYKLFLWTALRNLKIGGSILASFPPEGTRPSIAGDRADLFNWMREAGAGLISYRRNCLPYRAPLFELNALRAGGLSSVPLGWRRGDLMVFRKENHVQMSCPPVDDLGGNWEEYRFGHVRMRIQTDENDPFSCSLQKIGKKAVLPSVSVRFPRRKLANVVTSGNRFLYVDSPNYLANLCKSFSYSPVERLADLPALDSTRPGPSLQLQRLIAREQREAAEYFALTDEF